MLSQQDRNYSNNNRIMKVKQHEEQSTVTNQQQLR